jgi:6-phosphogluconolactonase (cycloisomerase 2 family)
MGWAVTVALLLLSATPTYAETPALTFLEVHRDGVHGVDGLLTAWQPVVSPDDAHVYVAGRDDHAVAVFARDRATGALTFLERERDGVGGVEDMRVVTGVAVSPDGAHLYAISDKDSAISVFARDPASGLLDFLGVHAGVEPSRDALFGPRFVTVSPDGAHVYVAAQFGEAITTFERDPTTGALHFLEMHRHGEDGALLRGLVPIVLDPESPDVYVGAKLSAAINHFERDAATGHLHFLSFFRAFHPLYSFQVPRSLALAPGGRHLYAAGGSGLFSYRRDPATGSLSSLEFYRDNRDGIDGIGDAHWVCVTPDGLRVFVAGWGDDAIAAFDRDPETGSLTFLDLWRDGEDGVDGLFAVVALALSGNGRHLYAASTGDHALAVFAVPEPRAAALALAACAALAAMRRATPGGFTRRRGGAGYRESKSSQTASAARRPETTAPSRLGATQWSPAR